MLRPLCSNEFPALTRLLINISKRLNEKYSLPAAAFTARIPWVEIFDISVSERTKMIPSFSVGRLIEYIKSVFSATNFIIRDLLDGCRFNFRFFGDYYLISYLLGSFILLISFRGLWGFPFLFIYSMLFVILAMIYFVL